MNTLLALALVVQLATEAVARLYPRYTVYVATGVGLLVALVTQAGVLASLGVAVPVPLVDWVLTGVILAGGAGVVNSLKSGLGKLGG